MMNVIHIRKGKDLRLKGAAEKRIEETVPPQTVAILPLDFRGVIPRLLIQPGQTVKVGTPLFEDHNVPEIKIVSPASGEIVAIRRGDKRVLQEIIIKTDGKQGLERFREFDASAIKNCSREDIIQVLLRGGVWPCLRQRPFSKIANPQDRPKCIFVQAMNTEPLALDVDVLLRDRDAEFQLGLEIIKKLTAGEIHLCFSSTAKSTALTHAPGVVRHLFSGPHPAGNVSTHIHYIDPIKKGDIVWYLQAEDVLRIARLFREGLFSPEKVVAVTGEGVSRRVYKKTIIGASLADIIPGSPPGGLRYISGSVLRGENVGREGFLHFYDSQVTVIPEGGKREFLGWLSFGIKKFSLTRTLASSFFPSSRELSLDTDNHGSKRSIILNDIYDPYVPLDILVYFLVRAILSGDLEEAERLGLLECAEEDFSLCSFVCPSKVDIAEILRRGLAAAEKDS
ncbi:MAG: Na(+)-translocating NADH-quinone reductase subunit A [Candidatus Omnitrophota bacterium]